MPQDENTHSPKATSKSAPVKPPPLSPLTESERKSTVQLPVGEHPPMLPPNIVQPATPAVPENTQPTAPASNQPGVSSEPTASSAPGNSSSDA